MDFGNSVNPRREAWRKWKQELQRNKKRKENIYELSDAPGLLMEFSLNGYLDHQDIAGSYIGHPLGFQTKQPFIFVVEVLHNDNVELPKYYKGILIKQVPAQTVIDETQHIREIYNGIYPEPETERLETNPDSTKSNEVVFAA